MTNEGVFMPYIVVGSENSSKIKIHYEDHGEGEVIVLIHGYPFSKVAWEKQEARFLREGYRVISYDRRGFGFSSRPSTGYDWNTFASDLDLLLKELSLENVTLVGHSMGTGEITRYLAHYGADRVTGAVFISPIPPFLLKTDETPFGVDQEVFNEFKESIEKDRYKFITEFLNDFYNPDNDTISEEKLRADFQIAASSSHCAFYQCVDTWISDFRTDLTKISVPSVIIQGDADQILPFEATGKLMAPEIGAALKVIPGGSHGIPWTHADEICDVILEFMFQVKKETLVIRGPEERDRIFNAH